MNPNTATEYRNLPLNVLTESTTNPRRIFEDVALKELHQNGRRVACDVERAWALLSEPKVPGSSFADNHAPLPG